MISPLEWILCGGILLPVGHWIFQKRFQNDLEAGIKETTDSFHLYELDEIRPFAPMTNNTFQFKATNLAPFRITPSEEATKPTLFRNLPDLREYEVGKSIRWNTKQWSYPIQVRHYAFPTGYVYSNSAGLVAKCRQTLIQDALRIQRGKTLYVAMLCGGCVGISWLFYGMVPEKTTLPLFYGLFRDSVQ